MSAFPTIVTRVQNGVVFTQEIADGKILWESQALECGPIPTDPDQTIAQFRELRRRMSEVDPAKYAYTEEDVLGFERWVRSVDFNLFHKAQSTALADAYSPAIKAMLGAKESASP